MFFFIGGIQPKTVEVNAQPRMCPSCGLHQARLKRVDHYLSLFFIPIIRVQKGTPFIQCQRCGSIVKESGEPHFTASRDPTRTCPYCGSSVYPSFRFCPACGKPLIKESI